MATLKTKLITMIYEVNSDISKGNVFEHKHVSEQLSKHGMEIVSMTSFFQPNYTMEKVKNGEKYEIPSYKGKLFLTLVLKESIQ